MHPGLQGWVMWLPGDVSPWGEFLEEVRAGYSQRSGYGEALQVGRAWSSHGSLLLGTGGPHTSEATPTPRPAIFIHQHLSLFSTVPHKVL